MRLTGAKVYDVRDGFVQRDVCIDGECIADSSSCGQAYDLSGYYVIPGLTDVHFHGAVGHDFSDGDAEGLQAMADYELSRGVTQICPAGMTLLEEQLVKVCQNAADHRKNSKSGSMLCGVNLEGPFLSYAKKGAQNGDWLHAPDVAMLRRLENASEGLVKLVSVAPEEPGALEFIREVADEVTVSIAHTTADYDTASAAFQAGARQVTHLFNAMPGFTHRAPGVVGAAFDTPDCRVELICDGIHVHPSAVRLAFRLFGRERMCLISDALRCCGMPDGQYTLGGQDVFLAGGVARLADGTIAGSATNLYDCMLNAVRFGIAREDAILAATRNPARALACADVCGSIAVGLRADFVICDAALHRRKVYLAGNECK